MTVLSALDDESLVEHTPLKVPDDRTGKIAVKVAHDVVAKLGAVRTQLTREKKCSQGPLPKVSHPRPDPPELDR